MAVGDPGDCFNTCGGAFLADLILFGSMGALEALRSNGMT